MAIDNCVNIGDRWLPFRNLNPLLKSTISETDSSRKLSQLEASFNKQKTEFISLLKNPPKNVLHSEVVQNANKNGIMVIENNNSFRVFISQEMINEALLLSNMFNLNELSALELLITGENQLSRYPDMTRGTIAVFYYYDGRRSVVSALKTLLEARNGRTWTSKVSRDMSRFITKYTDELKEENIVVRCIDLLTELDIVAEFEMLEKNRALGPSNYRKRVLNILKETRQMIAEIIFNYAAQTHFTQVEIFKLLDYLSNKSQAEGEHLDYVSSTLLISFLYVIDVSSLQDMDDNDKQSLNIPWIQESTLSALISKLERTEFNIKPIKSILQFGLAISLKILSIHPPAGYDFEIDEDKLVDTCFEDNIFENFNRFISQNPNVFKEEFYVRGIHNILCDFIVNMSSKLKELRDKADESERLLNAFTAEAIKPFSSLSLEFEKFLNCLANLYLSEDHGLANDFWVGLNNGKPIKARQQTLHKFVRSLHESFFPHVLHASVIQFFQALARTSPFNVFNMIKTTSFHTSLQFSLSSFSDLLNEYLNSVRGSHNKDRISASTFSSLQLPSASLSSSTMFSQTTTVCAIVKLIEEIVRNDRTCCQAMAESQQHLFITTLVAILKCAVPRQLKADILKCFSAFAKVASVSTLIWKEIDTILPRFNLVLGHHKLCQNGIAIEIEEIEVKNEEYPITIGFLQLINSLFAHFHAGGSVHQQTMADNCLSFIVDSILLKSIYRMFKNENEKWIMVRLCYQILLHIVEKCDQAMGTGGGGENMLNARAFNIFSQMLQESHLYRHVILVLEDIIHYHRTNLATPTLKDPTDLFEDVEETGITIVSLLTLICERQDVFFAMIRKVQGLSVSTFIKFDVLFNNINPSTRRQDRLALLLRLIPFSTNISIAIFKLLTTLCESNFEMTYLCLMQVHNASPLEELKSEVLINNFVECLENDSKLLRQVTLRFIDTFLGDSARASTKYNFAHKLVGIESKLLSLKKINLFGQNYTCLHSILWLFDNSMSLEEVVEERRLGMKIIYKLCSSMHTHELILRFLRTSYDFNYQYLKFWMTLYEERNPNKQSDETFYDSLLPEMSYFMKILAIDIHITSKQKLKSYYSNYINFLFKETNKPRIIDLYHASIFRHNHPPMKSFDYFDTKELSKTIGTCLSAPDNSIDLQLLHQRLYNEIHALSSQIGATSTGILREEITNIMLYCSELNKSIGVLKQKVIFLESWSELVQVIIFSKCLDTFEEEINSRYLTEINIELVNKVLALETNEAMFSSISATVLIASYSLYEIRSQNVTAIFSLIRSILQALESNSTIWSQQKRVRVNFYGALLYLFRLLPSNLFKEIKFSSNLLDKLTKDVLSGHEVAKMLSISILNCAEPSHWLNELIKNGTLKQLLLSLLSDDREIRANKNEFSKAFYVFESKTMLLLKLFSIYNVNNVLLNNLDIISILESLQCFDIYPYDVCENQVCFKLFADLLRLMITIATTTNQQIISEIGSFVSSRSILYDLIKIAPTIKENENGNEVLLLVCRLVGRLILNVNHNLQSSFIGLLSLYSKDMSSPIGEEIVSIILPACVQLISFNPSSPIFKLTLANADSRMHSQHSLGTLISIIQVCSNRSSESKLTVPIVESCLYLILIHSNIYLAQTPEMFPEQFEEIENFKNQADNFLNDAFFAKVQTLAPKNTFVEAISRRIRRLIMMKKTSAI